jgi:hypothetical protein
MKSPRNSLRAAPQQDLHVPGRSESSVPPIETPIPPTAPSASRRLRSLHQTYENLFTPWWKRWSPRKVALATLGFALAMGALVLVAPKLQLQNRAQALAAIISTPTIPLQAILPEEEPIVPVASAVAEDRADEELERKGRSPISGGLLTLPSSFASADGAFDLVIHFHGNTDLVEESFNVAKLNAAVVIMNLGVGSGAYEDRFNYPAMLPDVLDRTRNTLEKRGLRGATLRRLALSAWSAGYGAIARILEQPAMVEKVDAILLFDGLHCGYITGTHELSPERLAPFERFVQQAALGKKLFSIAHSNITPDGNYAGTRVVTDALLKSAGATRTQGGDEARMPHLATMDGVLPKKSLRPLVPSTEAHLRGLHARGYVGDQPEHHIMHLVQMSETALPDLIHHWNAPAAP